MAATRPDTADELVLSVHTFAPFGSPHDGGLDPLEQAADGSAYAWWSRPRRGDVLDR